jgi:hypothetical protein
VVLLNFGSAKFLAFQQISPAMRTHTIQERDRKLRFSLPVADWRFRPTTIRRAEGPRCLARAHAAGRARPYFD